jgi:signal transduction histidine kinase
MRERAMLIGATLTVETGPTGGVEVTLTAPPPR